MKRLSHVLVACALILAGSARPSTAQDSAQNTDDAARFFESKIRPVLVEHCYQCHSAESETLQGGLRLDTKKSLRTGGDSGPAIDADKPADSLLLSALRYDGFEMPPDAKLPDSVIHDFEAWVAAGAFDPRTSDDSPAATSAKEIDIEQGRQFWSFQPPRRSTELDEAKVADSARIDILVRRRLAEAGISPNASASREALIRRLSFDLIGLPPTFEQVREFAAEDSGITVEMLVDRLLDSPRYGERWARVWMDVARFAEDQAHIVGDNKALFYPNAWLYRDWVINSLNDDMPYDRFVSLQLAADLIAADDSESQAALGFIGLGPKYYNRGDPEVMAEELEDRVDVVARGLQGLTVACARCHDHKYDPIPTEDYYALAGIFAGTDMFNKAMDGKEANDDGTAKDPGEAMHVVRDGKPQDLNVMIRGNVNNKGDVVPRGFLTVAFPGDRRTFEGDSGRTGLAEAITDPANPLTARVIVNRIWRQYFGRGIVGTPSNFGQLGEPPTHPELLDDLAFRFMQNGWSLKWLHRQIVLSQTYQKSSDISDAALQSDAQNALLWRIPRRRLSVEAWRDAVLQVTGRLDETIGGTSVRADDPEATRRTVYSEISRFQLNPLLARFDFPDANVHAAKRVETNTPLQKLFLLNSPFMQKQAEVFAERIRQRAGDANAAAFVDAAFELALQRQPDTEERSAAAEFLTERPDDGLQQLAHSLLVSNEFWWLD
ncbi:MAG: PSD1 and planctomycete cytochrome C domain-containing protein [Planctomycetaceae bacterium]